MEEAQVNKKLPLSQYSFYTSYCLGAAEYVSVRMVPLLSGVQITCSPLGVCLSPSLHQDHKVASC